MRERKSPLLTTRGGCTAQRYDNSSIAALYEPFNEEITLAVDEDFVNQQLNDCLDTASLKREIVRLYVNDLLPYTTVERLFAKFNLGRY